MSGRRGTAVITGATSGIGAALAERIVADIDTLVIHGPLPEHEVTALLEQLRTAGSAQIIYLQADFARREDVAAFVSAVRTSVNSIDLLVNNAVAGPDPERVITDDGFERALQIDYLAMVEIVAGLADIVRGRIVNLASETHQSADLDLNDVQLDHGYSSFGAYQRAKAAIVAFTLWLAPRFSTAGPAVVAVCPGLTDTPPAARIVSEPERPAGRAGCPQRARRHRRDGADRQLPARRPLRKG